VDDDLADLIARAKRLQEESRRLVEELARNRDALAAVTKAIADRNLREIEMQALREQGPPISN
jgi:hypothetical protein